MIEKGKPNAAERALMYILPFSFYFMFKCVENKDVFGAIYMFIFVFIGCLLAFEWGRWKWQLVPKIRKGTKAVAVPERQEIPIMDCVDYELKFKRLD